MEITFLEAAVHTDDLAGIRIRKLNYSYSSQTIERIHMGFEGINLLKVDRYQ